jgi:hypothetical protein
LPPLPSSPPERFRSQSHTPDSFPATDLLVAHSLRCRHLLPLTGMANGGQSGAPGSSVRASTRWTCGTLQGRGACAGPTVRGLPSALEISGQGEETVICGVLADQPALDGLLTKVRDLGLGLISVR